MATVCRALGRPRPIRARMGTGPLPLFQAADLFGVLRRDRCWPGSYESTIRVLRHRRSFRKESGDRAMNVEISVLLVGLAAMSSLGCSGSEAEPARPTLVHVQGDRLVDAAGAPLALEGIILGEAAPTANPLDHGASAAYAEIAA